jgi:hypothetical protein
MFPLERIARNWPGVYDGNFDDSQLPFEIVKDIYVENVSDRIPKDEFDYCKSHLGSETVQYLEQVSYVIIHRFPNIENDSVTGTYVFEPELLERSRELVQRIVACLRLIRPTPQHAQFMGGEVEPDGTLRHFHFDNPYTFIQSVPNQQLFGIRTSDLEALRFYAPLFIYAIAGQYWKYIMAVDMFQSGFFQHSHWKLRFFMWTAALEALFTSDTSAQHRGSLVAKERIKWLLGENTLIYPAGELSEFDNDPKLTVGGVIDEIYCLRNHIAHGDKVPDYYFTAEGRTRDDGSVIPRRDMLMEAISSIVRQSLLLILKNGLLPHFKESAASESYFKGQTKSILEKRNPKNFKCPN